MSPLGFTFGLLCTYTYMYALLQRQQRAWAVRLTAALDAGASV